MELEILPKTKYKKKLVVRNTAKNKIQEKVGGRKDYKIDCIASEFKDWEISW